MTERHHLTRAEQKVMDRALRKSVKIIDHNGRAETRLEHAERCLRAAIQQIKVDAELLYEGVPHEKTIPELMWEEYRRVHGIGMKP